MSRTTNLKDLRRELSRVMREPFFRRIGDSRPVSYAAADQFADSALGRFDASEGWPYAFAYIPSTGEQREIIDFASDGSVGYAYVSPDWTVTPGVGYEYEIHSIWSAQEKTDALNHAVHDCWPAFYEVLTDESTVIEKWKKEYSLLHLANHTRHIMGVFIEPMWKVNQGVGCVSSGVLLSNIDTSGSEFVGESIDGETGLNVSFTPEQGKMYAIELQGNIYYITSWHQESEYVYTYTADRLISPPVSNGAASLFLVPGVMPAGVTSLSPENWFIPLDQVPLLESGKSYEIAIYYGTGSGQYRQITSGQTGEGGFFVSSPWTTVPDETSEFCIKNVSDQAYNWQGPIVRYRLDSPESPTMLALHWDATEYWGAKMRIVFATEIDELRYEADTVPDQCADFLIHMAAYHLWLGNIGRGPQFETKTAEKLAQQNKQDAEELRERNRMKRLNGQIRIELDNYGPAMREKPFSR